jgi:hypothetical protein
MAGLGRDGPSPRQLTVAAYLRSIGSRLPTPPSGDAHQARTGSGVAGRPVATNQDYAPQPSRSSDEAGAEPAAVYSRMKAAGEEGPGGGSRTPSVATAVTPTPQFHSSSTRLIGGLPTNPTNFRQHPPPLRETQSRHTEKIVLLTLACDNALLGLKKWRRAPWGPIPEVTVAAGSRPRAAGHGSGCEGPRGPLLRSGASN